jgi:hypothetical protein
MAELIDSKQAAEIFGVSVVMFCSGRLGICAPNPVKTYKRKNWFDKDECKAWAGKNNFWALALDYRRTQRYPDTTRIRKSTQRLVPKKHPAKGERSQELVARDLKDQTPPLMKLFLRGDFAPAHKKAAYEMKALRARLNKPETVRVQLQGDGGY